MNQRSDGREAFSFNVAGFSFQLGGLQGSHAKVSLVNPKWTARRNSNQKPVSQALGSEYIYCINIYPTIWLYMACMAYMHCMHQYDGNFNLLFSSRAATFILQFLHRFMNLNVDEDNIMY